MELRWRMENTFRHFLRTPSSLFWGQERPGLHPEKQTSSVKVVFNSLDQSSRFTCDHCSGVNHSQDCLWNIGGSGSAGGDSILEDHGQQGEDYCCASLGEGASSWTTSITSGTTLNSSKICLNIFLNSYSNIFKYFFFKNCSNFILRLVTAEVEVWVE